MGPWRSRVHGSEGEKNGRGGGMCGSDGYPPDDSGEPDDFIKGTERLTKNFKT